MTEPQQSPLGLGATVDPDVDLRGEPARREWSSHRWVLPVVAVGGMLGATARYLLATAHPAPAGGIPWGTFTINVTGCLLIGVLMVFVVEVGGTHPLLRPFLGVGVLGGYTTFSTYTVETLGLLRHGATVAAITYLLLTAVAALVAVALGASATRGTLALVHRRRRSTDREEHR
ncbi:fluoride efflux transporter CrcB [Pedococcus sp. NPDC057267]|uniref:fluoride efflux transporter CrcB n=1 Tax=Pedococcus sp. NPDC057267 TaxID=3346077 RepID=UPI00363B6C8E